MKENIIGKKVNLLEKVGIASWKMSEKTYEIVSVKEWTPELNDWCNHYIVRDENGEDMEIREVEYVFSPNNDKAEEHRIYEFLRDNGVWADVWREHQISIAVAISWGDWKHEHLWARDLMSYLGYGEIGSEVTEEDGSDCYSATHYFIKNA